MRAKEVLVRCALILIACFYVGMFIWEFTKKPGNDNEEASGSIVEWSIQMQIEHCPNKGVFRKGYDNFPNGVTIIFKNGESHIVLN